MGIIVRDIQEKEMTVYNPDGSILVVTHNMLCIDDICVQIKEQGLEGYTIEQEGSGRCEITKHGRIKGRGFGYVSYVYLNKLMGFKHD